MDRCTCLAAPENLINDDVGKFVTVMLPAHPTTHLFQRLLRLVDRQPVELRGTIVKVLKVQGKNFGKVWLDCLQQRKWDSVEFNSFLRLSREGILWKSHTWAWKLVAITTSARNYILRFSLKKGGLYLYYSRAKQESFSCFNLHNDAESRAAKTNVTLRPPPAFLAGAPSMVRQKLLYRRAIWGKRQFFPKR